MLFVASVRLFVLSSAPQRLSLSRTMIDTLCTCTAELLQRPSVSTLSSSFVFVVS